MISLFEKNLKRAKQELTDLKTAHERGLGTIRFFRYRLTFAVSSMTVVEITANVDTGEPGRPLTIVLARGTNRATSVQSQTVRSGTSQIVAHVGCYQNDTAVVDFISSSALTNFSWRTT